MKFSLLFLASAVAAPLARAELDGEGSNLYPVDPLPPVPELYADDTHSTTTGWVFDEAPPTTLAELNDKCAQCLSRQAKGENIACGGACGDVKPQITTKAYLTTTTKTAAMKPAGLGDVCFRFCEGNEQPMVQRACAVGLECTSPGGYGFDSCFSRAFTCQDPAANGDSSSSSTTLATTTTTSPGGQNFARVGDICQRFCEDGSQSVIFRDCAPGLTCKSPMSDDAESFDTCGNRASTCVRESCACEAYQQCVCDWWSCSCVYLED